MAQLVERVLGKDEVTGSIPVSSSKTDRADFIARSFFSVSELLTGDSPLTTARPISKNKKGECAPRHGDAFCRKFVKRKGVGQNANPSQNETDNKVI